MAGENSRRGWGCIASRERKGAYDRLGSMKNFVSLVVLSYRRPQFLSQTLQSLWMNTVDIPYELIVVDDGSRDACWPFLFQMLRQQLISTLVVNGGQNLGVGEGIYRGFAIAQGNYLAKLDADLEYHPGWLAAGVAILDARPDIGMVGFFDYRHYAPQDVRFNVLEKDLVGDQAIGIVDDFVSSAFLIRRETYEQFGPIDRGSDAFAEDIMFKRKLQAAGLKLAITIPDLIVNRGFGLGNSIVVQPGPDGEPVVTRIAHQPLLFGGRR